MKSIRAVIPAKAGTQLRHEHWLLSIERNWVPAFAGMTEKEETK